MQEVVLIVSDDPNLQPSIGVRLLEAGYEPQFVSHGDYVIRCLLHFKPSCVLLDLSGNKLAGWNLCREIRQASSAPLIVFNNEARRDDVINALDLGADEYLVKPLQRDVLLAKMKALLRRYDRAPDKEPRILRWDCVTIDLGKCSVMVDGQAVHLDRTEWRLLHYLARNANRIVPHEELLRGVWGLALVTDKNLVQVPVSRLKVYVKSLRKKLEKDPSRPKWILCQVGMGYYLSIPASAMKEKATNPPGSKQLADPKTSR